MEASYFNTGTVELKAYNDGEVYVIDGAFEGQYKFSLAERDFTKLAKELVSKLRFNDKLGFHGCKYHLSIDANVEGDIRKHQRLLYEIVHLKNDALESLVTQPN